jgi:parallel beta-helix repeat protein
VTGVCDGPITISRRADLTIQGTAPTDLGCPPEGLEPADLTSTVTGGDHDVIRVKRSEGVVIRYLNIVGGGTSGVELYGGENGEVSCNCLARNMREGVELDRGGRHAVRENLVVRNGGDGIRLNEAWGNVIVANTLDDNGDDGIELERDSDRNEVADNHIGGNAHDGIDLEDAARNVLIGNTVADNGDRGIEVERDSNKNQVADNWVHGNAEDGIILRSADRNVLIGNTITDNGDDGIELRRDSGGNKVVGNRVQENAEDGIDLDDADRNQVIGNEVVDNGTNPKDTGIELLYADRNVVDGNAIRGNADGLIDKIQCRRGSRGNTGSNVTRRCGRTTSPPAETFTFPLSGEQTNPPTGSSATGVCTGVLDATETEFQLLCTHNVAETTAAHIHRGAVGVNGPVVFDLGSPESPIGATWNPSPSDVAALRAQELYVNVHSSAFRGGEIRGQIE